MLEIQILRAHFSLSYHSTVRGTVTPLDIAEDYMYSEDDILELFREKLMS